MGDELSAARYQALAEFRYQVRRFQHFSEEAARAAGVVPQQHQLLLALKAADDDRLTIGEIAKRLMIQHHSAFELVARAEARGLVQRLRGDRDRRQVFVSLTRQGDVALSALSSSHHHELQSAAPDLIRTLQAIIADDQSGS